MHDCDEAARKELVPPFFARAHDGGSVDAVVVVDLRNGARLPELRDPEWLDRVPPHRAEPRERGRMRVHNGDLSNPRKRSAIQ